MDRARQSLRRHVADKTGKTVHLVALGRLFAPDKRDKKYPVRDVLRRIPRTDTRYWFADGWWGDQGETSMCVGYGWAHWLEDGPVTQPGKGPIVPPKTIYGEAQKVDEWPGEDYEGTSVRAGAKVLQGKGFIKSYYWATKIDDVVNTVLSLGPVVVGTNWYDSMFRPDAAGFVHVDGKAAGGHCYVIDGVNKKQGYFRLKNSWGRSWGNHGFALVSIDDFERLLKEDGEACLAVETKGKKAAAALRRARAAKARG